MNIQPTPLEAWIGAKAGFAGQPFDRQALRAYQLACLRQTLRLAREKSPFYRRRLANLPLDLAGLEDIATLPFTTAEDVRAEGLHMLCVSQGEIKRVVTLDTTGTTGQPKRLFFTRADQELTIDFFGIGMTALVGRSDRVLILLPGELPGSVGDLLQSGLERVGVVALKQGPVKDVRPVLERIVREQITTLVGVPVQVLALAAAWRVQYPNTHCPLKQVLLSTDSASTALVRRLEGAWGCAVYQHYGMTEMGLGGGVTCAAQQGYHLREADLYFEIVDPRSGEPLPEGEWGEVVFTTLTRNGMPLIRYRTGDLSRFIPTPCACGTALKLLDFIPERTGSRARIGQAGLALSELDETLFALAGVVDYTAGYDETAETACLSLLVYQYPDIVTPREQIEARLGALPVLRQALDRHVLALDVRCLAGFPPSLGTMRKRAFHIQ